MDVHSDQINDIKLNSAENMALTCSSDKILRLFNVNNVNLSLSCELSGHTSEISSAIFITDDLIASADYSGDLILWSRQGGSFFNFMKIPVCGGAITSLASLSQTSTKIACGCFDGNIRIITVNGNTHSSEEIFVSEYGVSSLSAASDFLLTGGMNFKANLYKNLKLIETFADHTGKINDVAFCLAGKENILCFATASSDKTVIIYQKAENTEYNKQTIVFPEEVFKICFNNVSLSLTASFGAKQYETYLPNADGVYEKAECEEITE